MARSSRPRIKPVPHPHIVVVDSNVLWHDDKKEVVKPAFQTFWDKYVQSFPMTLMIPEIVRGELLFQQTTSAHKLLNKAEQNLKEVSAISELSFSRKMTKERVKSAIAQRFDKWVSKLSATIVPIPITQIDWNNVIQSSIWRELPFTKDEKNPKNEKGFRDAMILETLISICDISKPNEQVAFICGDYALARSAKNRLANDNSFTQYDSLEDFESYVKLTQQNLNHKFVLSITKRATEKFFTQKNRRGLWFDEKIREKINIQFESELENPRVENSLYMSPLTPTRWISVRRDSIYIHKPQFVRTEGKDTYIWRSPVIFSRPFRTEPDIVMLPQSLFSNRMRVLTVDVQWSADVKTDGRFFNVKYLELSKVSVTFNVIRESPDENEVDN